MVVDLPTFSGPHTTAPIRVEEADIESCRRIWLGLLAAWQRDPRAEVELDFPPRDPTKAEKLIYHEMTATERAIVDREFAGAAAMMTNQKEQVYE